MSRQGGIDALWTEVGFCVTMGQKLINAPSNSLFQGRDEALSAIKLRQPSLTPPLNPPPPPPWGLAGWLGVGKKSVRWSGRCRIEALGHSLNLFGVQN